MRNIKTYFNQPKKFDPTTKLKYTIGLGDLISWLLHSKPIGPITYLITGNLTPCSKCNSRRVALNILFPIPIWKKFFKNMEEYNQSLKSDYEKSGVKFLTQEEIENYQKIERENIQNPIIKPDAVEEKIILTMGDMIKNSQI